MIPKEEFVGRLIRNSSAEVGSDVAKETAVYYSLLHNEMVACGMVVSMRQDLPVEDFDRFNRPEHPGRAYFGSGDNDWVPV